MTFERSSYQSNGFFDKLSYIFYIFLGAFVALPAIVCYILVTLPFFLYYQLIAFLLSKCFRRRLGYQKMVALNYTKAYAIELLSSVAHCQSSIATIASSTVIEGTVPLPEFEEKIRSNWINAKTPNGQLQHPEFCMYIDSWMGYTYWRTDANFKLSNHLKYHQLDSSVDLDAFTVELYEKLFNTPYIKTRSPWEVHIVHGWKVSSSGEKIPATVFVTKTHHVLGDGLSIMSVVVHGIVEQRLLDLQVVGPALTKAQQEEILRERQRSASKPFVKRAQNKLLIAIKLIHDLGVIFVFVAWRTGTGTRFHVPQSKKRGKLFYERSKQIPMEKVKRIKNHFGVRFSSVLLSCVSAATANFLDEKDTQKNFLMVAPRPLPTHPLDKMVNEFTGVGYKLCVAKAINPVKRLRENERVFSQVSSSLFPYVLPLLEAITAFHVTPVVKLIYWNWAFGTIFSNIAGPRIPVQMKQGGNHILEVNASVGALEGVMGLALLAFSYNGNFYLNAVAEDACLSKLEAQHFLDIFVNEIELLHQLTFDSGRNTSAVSNHVIVPLLDELEPSKNSQDANANDV